MCFLEKTSSHGSKIVSVIYVLDVSNPAFWLAELLNASTSDGSLEAKEIDFEIIQFIVSTRHQIWGEKRHCSLITWGWDQSTRDIFHDFNF